VDRVFVLAEVADGEGDGIAIASSESVDLLLEAVEIVQSVVAVDLA
jgi:hypothetical protein